ncbi:MAG: leucyl aminopeptidase family protein [Pseudoruegeria sp.]
MPFRFASDQDDYLPLHLVEGDQVDALFESLPMQVANWIKSQSFCGTLGQAVAYPAEDGTPAGAVIGLGDATSRRRTRFGAIQNIGSLPKGAYEIVSNGHSVEVLEELALGWLLSEYQFDRYHERPRASVFLRAPEGVDASRLVAIAGGEALTRELINTPASDMGPAELENAVLGLSLEYGAEVDVTRGDDLIDQGFPLIHTVGRAAEDAPRLLDLRWGSTGPSVTLVGKGVCFDTGGLNLKPGGSMGLMKKDMGGAATVLGLASMIMSTKMPIQLRVLIPAVENAVAGNAFRPGDILTARNGLTVEINNTDAEGRLVLADALAFADEEMPDVLISMATLTGAARVAVGPDLAPFYAQDDGFSSVLSGAAERAKDPVWRMPFWDPYETMIEPGIADLDNAPSGGFAGSITAALFLRRFVSQTANYTHFDIYGWQPAPAPARPKGGVGQGARALFEALPKALKL